MNIEKALLIRSNNTCELCTSKIELQTYTVPPVADDSDTNVDKSIMVCHTCYAQLENPGSIDVNHWRCLNQSMWSEIPAVQVVAWRMLKQLSAEGWAQTLLESLYLDEELLGWAQENDASDDAAPTLDSNGAVLQKGDSVTLIKDLVVKGANFTAKRGTSVRNISLTDNPEHIEGKVNGTQIVLLTQYLKKSS